MNYVLAISYFNTDLQVMYGRTVEQEMYISPRGERETFFIRFNT